MNTSFGKICEVFNKKIYDDENYLHGDIYSLTSSVNISPYGEMYLKVSAPKPMSQFKAHIAWMVLR